MTIKFTDCKTQLIVNHETITGFFNRKSKNIYLIDVYIDQRTFILQYVNEPCYLETIKLLNGILNKDIVKHEISCNTIFNHSSDTI